VAHACNPTYSGGRDQEDLGSQPRQIVHKTLSQKNPSQKTADGVTQSTGTEFKSQYCKEKKKRIPQIHFYYSGFQWTNIYPSLKKLGNEPS
jgi:hypothetical protein